MDRSFFKNKKALITGGAGFIGSNLCKKLVEAGALVTVIDSLREGGGGNLFSLREVREKIRFLHLDLALDFPQPELESEEFDYVFNLAGSLGHSDSMRRPKDDLSQNVVAHLQLLQWLGKRKTPPKVLFSSTRQIYGAVATLPVTESAFLNPVDINGAHKICAEYYHQIFSRHFGIPTVIIRLTNTYGENMALRGSDLGVANAFFSAAIRGDALKVFGNGSQVRDFSYVEDVVNAFMQAAISEKSVGEIFNLGGEAVSLKIFAEKLKGQFPDLKVEEVSFPLERKSIDIGDFVADDQKIRKLLGWEPQVDLDEGVMRTSAFFSEFKRHYL